MEYILYRIAGKIASAMHLATEATFARKLATSASEEITRVCPDLVGFKDYNAELGKGRRNLSVTFAMESATLTNADKIGMIGFEIKVDSSFTSMEPDSGWSEETPSRIPSVSTSVDAVISTRYYNKLSGGGNLSAVGALRPIGYSAIGVDKFETVQSILLPDDFCQKMRDFINLEVMPVAPTRSRPIPVSKFVPGGGTVQDQMWGWVSNLQKWLKSTNTMVVFSEELLNSLEAFAHDKKDPREYARKHLMPGVWAELRKTKLRDGTQIQLVEGDRPVI